MEESEGDPGVWENKNQGTKSLITYTGLKGLKRVDLITQSKNIRGKETKHPTQPKPVEVILFADCVIS